MAFAPCTTRAIVRPPPPAARGSQTSFLHVQHTSRIELTTDLIASLFRFLAPFVYAPITTRGTKPRWKSAPSSHRATGAHTRGRQKMCCPPSSLQYRDVSPHGSQRRTVRFPVLERLASGDIASVSACGLANIRPRWKDVMATASCTPTTNYFRTDQLPRQEKHPPFMSHEHYMLQNLTLNNTWLPASRFPRTVTQHRSEPKDGEPVSAWGSRTETECVVHGALATTLVNVFYPHLAAAVADFG